MSVTLPQRAWGAKVWRCFLFVLLGCWMAAPSSGVRHDPGIAMLEDSLESDEADGESMTEMSVRGIAKEQRGIFARRRRSVTFNAADVGGIFTTLGASTTTATAGGCATVLEATVHVAAATWQEWRANQRGYEVDLVHREVSRADDPSLKSDGQWLYAIGDRWGTEWVTANGGQGGLTTPSGHLAVKPGMRIVKVAGRTLEPGDYQQLLQHAEEVGFNMTFKAGLDLRQCWSDMIDDTGEPVCGKTALSGLGTELSASGEDQTFQIEKTPDVSVDKLPNFKIQTIPESMANLLYTNTSNVSSVKDEDPDSCYQTALAPICVVLQIPRNCAVWDDCKERPDVFWLAQRKINLVDPETKEPETKLSMALGSDQINSVSLIGPKLLNPINSVGQWIGQRKEWRREDAGFVRMFPYGLHWYGCGSRQAARMLELDAFGLKQLAMTNYKLTATFYKGSSDPCKCQNMTADKKLWPLVVHACPGVEGAESPTSCAEPIRIAFSITNWLDQDVDSVLNPLGTAKAPETYMQWWVRMWPQYFHLERRRYSVEDKHIVSTDEEPAELLEVGDTVVALMKIKWKNPLWCGAACVFSQNLLDEDEEQPQHKFFKAQIDQISSQFTTGGSVHKVIAGQTGVVVAIPFPAYAGDQDQTISNSAIAVRWNHIASIPGEDLLFRVELDQVMRSPRLVELEATTTIAAVLPVISTSHDFWDDRTGSSGPRLTVLVVGVLSIVGIFHRG